MNRVFVSHPRHMLDHYFGARAAAALAKFADVTYNAEDRELTPAELAGAARDADVIIAYRQTPAPRALFEALPKLAAFVRCAVDIRTIDVDAASELGVLVTQASAGFVPAVSEWVIGVMLDLARGTTAYAQAYHRHEAPAPKMGRELRGSTFGVIGYGQISRYLCDLALAFGMRVIVSDPYVTIDDARVHQAGLEDLLGEADFVACLAPATPQTTNLMNARAFAAMKPGAYFINAARGELVDDAALLAALERGHLAGCALDVGRAADQMPSPSLAAHSRVIATPHIGGLTPGAIEHQSMETIAQTEALFQGRTPVGAVNAAHAYRLSNFAMQAAAQ
ncbi:D-isomer specific 2-hydroxyacid dehydrogenase, NAD binding domain protein [Burkholderia thailandensis 34]|uniref:hydroxyacid dehydrogenase n=1 Tax=Burkholderia thailandensis TaxID=57975 RepID=UPI0005DA559B|nr:hydroxyacid dehydrogenase [Burkholderia thailandensis]AJY32335.1 D-isomer specific 2-hydroxyacid dehydrogenase, NAD binding domain protein [Burkholderia thailandensis 34]AOJ59909.1 hydroxyacid dehydrogenase [Burkholderia thailandensis]KXF59279.1 hydroxyacid dehydrogenase [Burkholderia thailandensis]PNE78387.1 hydroxyacid dehydrogenase [Burkholderia thailandensis]